MRISELFEGDEPIRLKLGSGMRVIPMDGISHDDDEDEEPKTIRLSAKRTTTAAQRYIADLENITDEHPFTRDMRYFSEGPVLVKMAPVYGEDDEVELIDIQSKARGAGAKALTKICALADEIGVSISLYAKGYAHVPTKKLVAYYQRFGFGIVQDQGDGVDMIRHPS